MQQPTGTRLSKLTLIVFLAVAMAAGLLWFAHNSPRRAWPLPDGSVLSLGQVTFGTNHLFRYGNRWQDFLYPIVPRSWRNKFHFKVATLTSERSDSVVVWLQRSTKVSRNGFARVTSQHSFRLAVLDEHGLESAPCDGSGSISIVASGFDIIGMELHDYPHRARR